ncbi:diacylglycerol/lipid kinase family protein [Chryseosolibacter indicus]|uniref:Diacylglycerol kinase family lipid kinase n=1 Tax=Chryseosolibacter indicus TaxID=2782351 RepID=A0ABS5VLZ5_9BACT|nr:diacylglycerol kinase family lipid kinase [Chryseosolibacter indicus]
MNESKKVLFIVNKYSGTEYRPEVEGRIIEACEKQDIECTIEFTQGPGHATELAQQVVDHKMYDMVVAVGGDGTVNEVAKGLLHSSIPMGIIPKGSGNGLARHLGISTKIPLAINYLFNSQTIAMDTFKVNGKLSLNVSGIGFDGHIANLFGKDKKRGLQGYAKLTISEFIRFKEFEAEITTENASIKRKAFIIAFANSSQYGNNARIAPAASVCDEILHVCYLQKVPAYRLDFVYNFFNGTIEQSSFCEIHTAKKVNIKLNTPMAFHIDGEPCGVDDHFQIEIVPHSLRINVPKHSLKF